MIYSSVLSFKKDFRTDYFKSKSSIDFLSIKINNLNLIPINNCYHFTKNEIMGNSFEYEFDLDNLNYVF